VHLSAGNSPDKTYEDPTKANSMASRTYETLQEAGTMIGTAYGAVPYSEILPFIQAFNRAGGRQDLGAAQIQKLKKEALDRLRQHVDQYRKEHKDDKKETQGPGSTGVCAAEFSQCTGR